MAARGQTVGEWMEHLTADRQARAQDLFHSNPAEWPGNMRETLERWSRIYALPNSEAVLNLIAKYVTEHDEV